jgi:tRNA-dihydrouridine synthase 3
VPVPVVGNGDLLFAHEIRRRLDTSGCAAVMVARGALIKPWIFRDFARGDEDVSAEARVDIYRRYVAIGLDHWGDDDHGRRRLRDFVRWHAGFWCRYASQRPDGSWPTMQEREGARAARSPLEALLARADDAALDYVTDELMTGGDFSRPPVAGPLAADPELMEAG